MAFFCTYGPELIRGEGLQRVGYLEKGDRAGFSRKLLEKPEGVEQ